MRANITAHASCAIFDHVVLRSRLLWLGSGILGCRVAGVRLARSTVAFVFPLPCRRHAAHTASPPFFFAPLWSGTLETVLKDSCKGPERAHSSC